LLGALLCAAGLSAIAAAAPASADALTLNAAATYTTGSHPQAVAVGDFNGDGKPDLAVANKSGGGVSVLLNTGNGRYGTAHEYHVGGTPVGVAVGDFKGEGKLDIAVVNETQEVTILWGNGAGEFPTKSTFIVSAASALKAVVAGNFNGHVDLVTFDNSGGPEVFVLLNNGKGEFPTQHTLIAAGPTLAIAVGDVNHDGDQDLVVGSAFPTDDVSVFLGEGNGSFKARETVETGETPEALVVTSLRGTAYPDVVTAGEGKYSVLLNEGNGKLAAASASSGKTVTSAAAAHVSENGLVAGRFAGDSHVDLALSDASTSEVAILRGKGDGTFESTPSWFKTAKGPTGLASAELDGSASADLVSADSEAASVSVLLSPFEKLAPSTNSLELATATAKSTGAWRGVTFTNTGNVPVSITQVVLQDLYSPDGNATIAEGEDTCRGKTLEPGATCVVQAAIRSTEASEFVEEELVLRYGASGQLAVELYGEAKLGPGNPTVSPTNKPEECPLEYLECTVLLVFAEHGRLSEETLIKEGIAIDLECVGSRCETTILLYGSTDIWALLGGEATSARVKHPKRVLLGEARVRLVDGQKKVVHVKLSAAARRVLRKLKRSVTIELVQQTKTGDGKVLTETRHVTISHGVKKPASHARKKR
jgi:hypothetical protein